MRLVWLSALLPFALIGCGGSGGSSSPGPVIDSIVEDGTAQFKVDLASGKVKILPIETGKSKSAIMGGSTVTFTTSDVMVEGGEQGRRSIKVSLRNNLKESIGGARPIRVHFGTTTPQLTYDTDVRDQTRAGTIWANAGGFADGPVSTALSGQQSGVAVGADGAVYVATNDNRIRKVFNGYVSTVAANCNVTGIVYLKDPASGREFLVGASYSDHVIRSINTSTGTVVTLAGAVGSSGNVNGAALTARFQSPINLAVEPGYGVVGNLVIADYLNGALRGLAFSFSGGNLVAGNVTTRFASVGNPVGVGVMADKTVVMTDFSGNRVRIFNVGGSRETTIGTGVAGDVSGAGNTAQFSGPRGIAISGSSIIIGDSGNRKLKRVQVRPGAAPLLSNNWQVSNFCFAGSPDYSDGIGTDAETNQVEFIALAPDGSFAMTGFDFVVRRIEADSPAFDLGSPQGSGSAGARLTNETGYALIDGNRRPYIDYDKEIAPGQTVDLGQWNFVVPETLPAFTFSVTVDSTTSIYAPLDAVSSNGISPGSDRVGVTDVIAGSTGFNLSTLPNSRIGSSYGGAYDRDGNLFVMLLGRRTILRFDRLGKGTIVAGRPATGGNAADGNGEEAVIVSPSGILLDPEGKGMYITDSTSHTVRFVGLRKDFNGQYMDPAKPANWQVTTIVGLIGTAGAANGVGNVARINNPAGICGTYGSTFFVVQRGNNLISKVEFDGGDPADPTRYTVAPFAGSTTSGFVNDTGLSARFNAPYAICESTDEGLIVADYGNHRLRRIDKSTQLVTTFAGNGGTGDTDNVDAISASIGYPYALAVDRSGAIYVNAGNRVRRVLDGEVKTVAGGGPSNTGRTGATRQFNNNNKISGFAAEPSGDLLAFGAVGNLYRLSRILGNR